MSDYRPAPEEDVVLSSRVRLARNYADIPFTSMMNRDFAEETIRRASASIRSAGQGEVFTLARMSELGKSERTRLVEHHLISYDLLKYAEMSAALISSGETVSIMINEEDHLRIQGLLPGMQLERAAELAFQADDWLGKGEKFAFDQQLGYLTSCPTNTGTGMRASTMLHLPALAAAGQIGNAVQTLGKLGLTVRGIYGEGSEAQGNLYQISNQVTLGRTEEDVVKSIAVATMQIATHERDVRAKIAEQDRVLLEDRFMRSLGILRGARLMNGKEFMQRYSDLRLAASLKVVSCAPGELDKLMMDLQSASLDALAGQELSDRDRDALRAAKAREALESLV